MRFSPRSAHQLSPMRPALEQFQHPARAAGHHEAKAVLQDVALKRDAGPLVQLALGHQDVEAGRLTRPSIRS